MVVQRDGERQPPLSRRVSWGLRGSGISGRQQWCGYVDPRTQHAASPNSPIFPPLPHRPAVTYVRMYVRGETGTEKKEGIEEERRG